MGKIRIVFDGPPGPDGGRFIEVEGVSGESINIGEWVERGDCWCLEIDDYFTTIVTLTALEAAVKEKERHILKIESALKRVATSLNIFSAISIARQALGADIDIMEKIREEAIENEQYVP